MTKKDYVLIATAVRQAYIRQHETGEAALATLDSLVEDLSCALANDNPNFNVQTFVAFIENY